MGKVKTKIKQVAAYRLAGSILTAHLYGELPDKIRLGGGKDLLKTYEDEVASIRKRVYYGLNQQESDPLRIRAEFLSTVLLAGLSAQNRLDKRSRHALEDLQPIINLLQDFAIIQQEHWINFGLLMLRASFLIRQNWESVKRLADRILTKGTGTVTAFWLLTGNKTSSKVQDGEENDFGAGGCSLNERHVNKGA